MLMPETDPVTAPLYPYTARPVVDIDTACTLAGVCRRTMHNWVRNHKVEFVLTAGGRVRIFADTLFKKAPDHA